MLNENIIKGKWHQIRGDIRAAWGKLTDDEVDRTKENLERITGLVREKYGIAQDEARKKLDAIVSRYEEESDYENEEEEIDREIEGAKKEFRDKGTRRVS